MTDEELSALPLLPFLIGGKISVIGVRWHSLCFEWRHDDVRKILKMNECCSQMTSFTFMNECVNSYTKYYKNVVLPLTQKLNLFIPIFILKKWYTWKINLTITSIRYGWKFPNQGRLFTQYRCSKIPSTSVNGERFS